MITFITPGKKRNIPTPWVTIPWSVNDETKAVEESRKGRTVDALALTGDEGRDKLR